MKSNTLTTEQEISLLGDTMQKRFDEFCAGGYIPPECIPSRLSLLTDQERARLHELKQMLPSAGEQAKAAQERNRERRRRKRQIRQANTQQIS